MSANAKSPCEVALSSKWVRSCRRNEIGRRTREDIGTRHTLLPAFTAATDNCGLRCAIALQYQESTMKILFSAMAAAGLLAGCISSSNPPPPQKTTVVVPQGSTTTVVCQNGNPPPCD